MTPEQLDEFEEVLAAVRMHGSDNEYVKEIDALLAPLVKALREAWARCETLRGLADEKAHDAGLYARRMEEAQKARSEAVAEAKKWHLKYDYVHGDLNAAVIEMNAAVEFADNAKAEVERLREVVRQVHALVERGLAFNAHEAIRGIHKITKGMVE